MRVTDEKFAKGELDCLALGGFDRDDFTLQNISITLPPGQKFVSTDKSQHYIHTLKIKQMSEKEYYQAHEGQQNVQPYKKRRLLFIVGYSATSPAYFAIFKELSKYFEVTGIDPLGWGGSGRPEYYVRDYQDTVDFFMT